MALVGKWIVSLLALLYSTCAMEVRNLPTETVLAWVGSSATLPCSLSPQPLSRTGYRKLALHWAWVKPQQGLGSGPGLERDRFTLLMVENDGVVKRGLIGRSRRMRVPGERLNRGNFSLFIREVRPEDSGVYHCSARFGEVRLEKVIKLNVVQVKPDIPGILLEGGRLKLLCRISEALSQAQVSWRRGGSPVQSSDRIATEADGRTLSIRQLEIEDRGAWECHVSCDGKTIDVPYTMEIFGFTRPKREVATTYASPGSAACLSLNLTPVMPGGRVEAGWVKDQQTGDGVARLTGPGPLPAAGNGTRGLSELRSGNLSLTLSPVLHSDRGFYMGYVAVMGHRIERTVRLELVEVTASRTGPVPMGSSLRLNINTSYPAGVERLKWQHDNGSAGQAGESFREDNGSLYIARVMPAHAGNWTCALYYGGQLVGTMGYILEVSAFDHRVGEPMPASNRITLVAVFTLFLLLIIFAIFAILRKMKSRRQNFPGLEVTLSTVDLPVKKL